MTNSAALEYLGGKGEKLLAKHIHSGENILFKAKGNGNRALIITDARVYLLKWGWMTSSFMGSSFVSFEYRNITGIDIRKKISIYMFQILTAATKPINTVFSDDEPENLITYTRNKSEIFQYADQLIKSMIANVSQPSASRPNQNSMHYLDELEKLASLKNSGILNEEEFQAKKKIILERTGGGNPPVSDSKLPPPSVKLPPLRNLNKTKSENQKVLTIVSVIFAPIILIILVASIWPTSSNSSSIATTDSPSTYAQLKVAYIAYDKQLNAAISDSDKDSSPVKVDFQLNPDNQSDSSESENKEESPDMKVGDFVQNDLQDKLKNLCRQAISNDLSSRFEFASTWSQPENPVRIILTDIPKDKYGAETTVIVNDKLLKTTYSITCNSDFIYLSDKHDANITKFKISQPVDVGINS